MPLHPRHVQPKVIEDHTSVGRENNDASNTSNENKTCRKRTLTSTQPSASASSSAPATDGPPLKKTRNTVQPRPAQLSLMSGEEPVQQEQLTGAIDKGKGKENNAPLQRTASFYPGHHGTWNTVPTPHVRVGIAREEDPFVDSDENNSDIGTEEQWYEEHMEDVTHKNPSKKSESTTMERPLWQSSVSTAGSSGAGSSASVTNVNSASVANVNSAGVASVTQNSASVTSVQDSNISASQESDTSWIDNTSMPNIIQESNATWPPDTELTVFPGTNKILLTLQSPLMRTIFQDAFERLRVSILFIHAFPNPTLTRSMAGQALTTAASSHLPRSLNIRTRLQMDEEYMSMMCCLPRARIALFRGEVKERCAALIHLSFVLIGSAPDIIQLVERQLSNYYYTFPMTQTRDRNSLNALPLRTRPYRNARIISVIKDLYFSGGTTAYAYRFENHFPTFKSDDGLVRHEVPIPMVALVATGLYAAIHEWHSGKHHATDFLTNSYLDVYQGHIDTFNFIQEHHPCAFHMMMSDIYSQASAMDSTTAVPIADINIQDLEG